jgi:hypothetical protein
LNMSTVGEPSSKRERRDLKSRAAQESIFHRWETFRNGHDCCLELGFSDLKRNYRKLRLSDKILYNKMVKTKRKSQASYVVLIVGVGYIIYPV